MEREASPGGRDLSVMALVDLGEEKERGRMRMRLRRRPDGHTGK